MANEFIEANPEMNYLDPRVRGIKRKITLF